MNIFRIQRPTSLPIMAIVSDPTRSLALRSGCINKLWTSGDPNAANMLVALTTDKNPEIRLWAVQGLGWLSEDTEIFDAEIRQMRIQFKHEKDNRVKEALRVALEAIKQNKKNTKLENPHDSVSHMFIKVDDDKPKGLPFLGSLLSQLPQLPFEGNPNAGISRSDIDPNIELTAMPLSGMPGFMNGSVSGVQQAVEDLSEEQKNVIKKKMLETVITALKRSKNGTAQPIDTIILTVFKAANSMISKEKKAQARKLIDKCFPNDVELLKENGFY